MSTVPSTASWRYVNSTLPTTHSTVMTSGQMNSTRGGVVAATDAPAVEGAEIEINGKTAATAADGRFALFVPESRRYVLNIRKRGYGLVSRIYDNGVSDPAEVKRRSRVPSNTGPCTPTHCAEGKVAEQCSADAQCDSSPGAGDGSCDACTVTFGISTDDEMFVLTGSFVPM